MHMGVQGEVCVHCSVCIHVQDGVCARQGLHCSVTIGVQAMACALQCYRCAKHGVCTAVLQVCKAWCEHCKVIGVQSMVCAA